MLISSMPPLSLTLAPSMPAINVASIQSHIPAILSTKAANYTKWSTFFLTACRKFGVAHHIDGTTEANPDDATWAQEDCTVRTWIYTSVSEEIHDLAMEPEQTARDIWVRIRDHFHSMIQGDLTIDEYFQQLKTTTDELRDVGHIVEESTLVLNALRGLSPRFSTQADIISFTEPLSGFAKTRSLLQTAEMKQANTDRLQTGSALLSTTTASNDHRTDANQTAAPVAGAGGRGCGREKNRNDDNNSQGRNPSHDGAAT